MLIASRSLQLLEAKGAHRAEVPLVCRTRNESHNLPKCPRQVWTERGKAKVWLLVEPFEIVVGERQLHEPPSSPLGLRALYQGIGISLHPWGEAIKSRGVLVYKIPGQDRFYLESPLPPSGRPKGFFGTSEFFLCPGPRGRDFPNAERDEKAPLLLWNHDPDMSVATKKGRIQPVAATTSVSFPDGVL